MQQNIQLNNTHPDDDNVPTKHIVNIRKAFHIVGALIGEGAIRVDLENSNWRYNFEHIILTTASALNYHD